MGGLKSHIFPILFLASMIGLAIGTKTHNDKLLLFSMACMFITFIPAILQLAKSKYWMLQLIGYGLIILTALSYLFTHFGWHGAGSLF